MPENKSPERFAGKQTNPLEEIATLEKEDVWQVVRNVEMPGDNTNWDDGIRDIEDLVKRFRQILQGDEGTSWKTLFIKRNLGNLPERVLEFIAKAELRINSLISKAKSSKSSYEGSLTVAQVKRNQENYNNAYKILRVQKIKIVKLTTLKKLLAQYAEIAKDCQVLRGQILKTVTDR